MAVSSGQGEPDDRVADDDRAVGIDGRQPAVDQGLADEAGTESAGRRGDVADDVVPGECRCPAGVRGRLGQGRLFDGEERPDLVPGR